MLSKDVVTGDWSLGEDSVVPSYASLILSDILAIKTRNGGESRIRLPRDVLRW